MPERPSHRAYDIFVSYDPHDASTVQELSRRVSTDGFRIWLDVWELVPGAPAAADIERAVADSLVFAACIGSRRSTRLDAELELARRGAPNGRPPRVIAILLPNGELPSDLGDLPVVDVRDGVSREAMDRLAQLISQARTEASAPGLSSLAQVDYRQVLAHVDDALEKDPSNAEALRARTFASMALGRHAEALATLERLQSIAPDDLMLVTTRIPLLVREQRSHEVPALVRSADAAVPRIVEQMAQSFLGKSESEVASETEALSNVLEMADRYSVRRLVDALRNDRERAASILRAELASLEAAALANADDAEGALSAWRRAVRLDPERTAYRLQIVQALIGAGQREELERELAEWESEAGTTAALLAQAWGALLHERTDDAMTHLDQAIVLDPGDPVPRAMRADLLVRQRRVADSVEDWRVLWENSPTNAQALSRLLAIYRTLGRLDDEAALLDAWADHAEPLSRGFARTPGAVATVDAAWLRNLGDLIATGELPAQLHARAEILRVQARVTQGRPDEALRLTRRAVSQWPRQYAPWAVAAEVLRPLDDAALAAAGVEAGEPAWVEPVWQALVALARDDAGRASTLLQQVLSGASDIGVVHWLHGASLEANGALEAAVQAFGRAIEIDRYAPAPLFSRANLLKRLGRLDEALADLDVALDDLQAGMEQEVYFERGEIRRVVERYRPAIEDFDRALTIPARDPAMPPIVIASRGQAKLGLGDIDGALQDLNAGLESSPDMVWALISRATAHLARRDVDSAIADRRRVVELRPGDPDAWAPYGMMLLETKQPEALWTALTEATRTDAALLEGAGIRVMLAQAAMATGRFVEAEQLFRAAADQDPGEDFWRYEEARAARHQGRMEDARALVQRALEQQVVPPTDAETYLAVSSNRCLYLLANGREQEALEEWRSLLGRVGDPALLRTQLEELEALEASGLRLPATQQVRSEVQARLEDLTSVLAG